MIKREMKQMLRRLFRLFGLQVARINKEAERRPADRNSLDDALQHIAKLTRKIGFEPLTVIDVGAAGGTYELYRAFPKAKFLLVEPLKEYESDMKKYALNTMRHM